MGWSKCMEDNDEMFWERMRDRETRDSKTPTELYNSIHGKRNVYGFSESGTSNKEKIFINCNFGILI